MLYLETHIIYLVPKKISMFTSKSSGLNSITVTGWIQEDKSECLVTYDVCISRKYGDCSSIDFNMNSNDILCELNRQRGMYTSGVRSKNFPGVQAYGRPRRG